MYKPLRGIETFQQFVNQNDRKILYFSIATIFSWTMNETSHHGFIKNLFQYTLEYSTERSLWWNNFNFIVHVDVQNVISFPIIPSGASLLRSGGKLNCLFPHRLRTDVSTWKLRSCENLFIHLISQRIFSNTLDDLFALIWDDKLFAPLTSR